MKSLFSKSKLSLIVLLSLIVFSKTDSSAQQVDLRKKISTSGSAEAEVTPDIIYINISLREYLKDGNTKKKVNITSLENELYNAIQKAGVAKENLTINNLSSWNYYGEKKKNTDFLASKQYRLKVNDLNKFNQIISEIDAKGIMRTNIDGYDYSKMEALKKELKIKAIRAAKEKATYLVEALGEKLGGVIDIQDSGDNIYQAPVYRNMMMKSTMSDSVSPESAPEIDFKKIKLNFTVSTVFEIK